MRVVKSLTLLSLIVVMLSMATPAVAVDTNPDILVSPATLDFTLAAGETISSTVTIVNDSTIDRAFQVKLRSFASGDNDGKPVLDDNLVTPLHQWLNSTDKQFTVPAKQKFDFHFSIAVPTDAGPGSYRTALLFSDLDPKLTESGSAVVAELGPLLFVTVKGDAVESATITQFDAANSINETLPIPLSVTFANQGNVDITPIGVVNISPLLAIDNHQYHFDFNPTSSKILAGNSRNFTMDWTQDGWHFGHYKAEIVVAYGQANKVITSETDFWIIPWKALAGVAVVLCLIIIVIKLHRRPDDELE